MSNRTKLERYLPIVSFLSAVCGGNYEVILHDASEPEQSVLAIHNGHLSGRGVGGPMTELARKLVRDRVYEDQDFISNYEGRTRNGKQFVSSTYFIKEDGVLLGLICVNHDVSDLTAMSQHLHNLMRAFSLPGEERSGGYTEELDDSISGLSATLIHNTVLNLGVPSDRMTALEKEGVIEALDRQGVFSAKGAVSQTARELGISEPTVYRYLRRVRAREA